MGQTKNVTFQHLDKLLQLSHSNFCSLTPTVASTLTVDDLCGIKTSLLISLGGKHAGRNLLESLLQYRNTIKIANRYGVT